jgi:anti-anti-sigma factor
MALQDPVGEAAPFSVSGVAEGGCLAVRIRGDLDAATRGQVQAVLDQHPEPLAEIRFEMGRVGFVDSSGLRLVVNAIRRMSPSGRVSVVQPSASFRRLLAVTQLDQRIQLEPLG